MALLFTPNDGAEPNALTLVTLLLGALNENAAGLFSIGAFEFPNTFGGFGAKLKTEFVELPKAAGAVID